DATVTGVQTCALPISRVDCRRIGRRSLANAVKALLGIADLPPSAQQQVKTIMRRVSLFTKNAITTLRGLYSQPTAHASLLSLNEIGRASCREFASNRG